MTLGLVLLGRPCDLCLWAWTCELELCLVTVHLAHVTLGSALCPDFWIGSFDWCTFWLLQGGAGDVPY